MQALLLLALTVPLSQAETAEPKPYVSSTSHTLTTTEGTQVAYTANAGWLIMEDEEGEPIARFGYTAYVRDGVDDAAQRPILFGFNGGPGSSSIWLHMGVLGPRRVLVNDGGFAPPPPASVVANPYSVLDL
ncbi:MAG: hypothetical protein AAGG01_23415, partial [Planctomycetota bacterium]